MTYVFRCPTCEKRVESPSREGLVECIDDGTPMVRDWRAEGMHVDRFALRVWGNRYTRRDPEGA
jgi:hypothetical protein